MKPRFPTFTGRRLGDYCLFGVTATELALLIFLTDTFSIADWIYVLQHLLVLAIALTRQAPTVQDLSVHTSVAVVIAYSYPYAQVIWLRWMPGETLAPSVGLALVVLAASLSLASLLSLGRRFGVFPALRELNTRGPYRLVRHPMYLAYMISDLGYNLHEWNFGTALLVLTGWVSLLYRIHAEERMLAHDAGWSPYIAAVRYRLLPGIW